MTTTTATKVTTTRYGYGNVSEKGYMAFTHDLSEGAWASVDISTYDNPERLLPADPLQVPRDIELKLRATWAIATLRDALGASPEVLAGLDGRWDATQRKFNHILGAAAEDNNAAVREAAQRCRGALLEGNGIAQTIRTYDKEVDFGRNQVALMSSGPLVADVTLLDLAAIRAEIHQATEALAQGIGRAPGEKRDLPRFERIRATRAACATAFNGIHQDLCWLIEHTPAGAVRTQLEALLAPFEALLSRYPASSTGDTAAEEEPVPASTAAPASS